MILSKQIGGMMIKEMRDGRWQEAKPIGRAIPDPDRFDDLVENIQTMREMVQLRVDALDKSDPEYEYKQSALAGAEGALDTVIAMLEGVYAEEEA